MSLSIFHIIMLCIYFHALWPLTRRTRPDRIPVVCFRIVGLFDHESPLVVTPLQTLAKSLDSDQARNFDKVSNYLKLWLIHELGPGPRHERS